MKDSVMKIVMVKGQLYFYNANTSKCHIKLDLKQPIQSVFLSHNE